MGSLDRTLLIDLSNVLRSKELRPIGQVASWGRLSMLLSAIKSGNVASFGSYHLVADSSLRRELTGDSLREMRSAESQGILEFAYHADTRLVELAFSAVSPIANALLVTNDYFDEFRREYPELDSAVSLSWGADDQGNPIPLIREFGERTHHRISSKEEEGELRRRRLLRDSVRTEATRWYYRCLNSTCLLAQFWPDHLGELPAFDENRETFVCPGCRADLERGDQRAPSVQIIVYCDRREVGRLLIEDGITIGRADSPGTIGLERFVRANTLAAVSREHVRIHIEGDRVAVEDLGSTNGTHLKPRQDSRPTTELKPGRKQTWQLRDALVLPNNVHLERSGRRHHFGGERAGSASLSTPSVDATRLVSGAPLESDRDT